MEFSGTPQPKWTFSGLEEDPYVYFVHSYYLHADDPERCLINNGIRCAD